MNENPATSNNGGLDVDGVHLTHGLRASHPDISGFCDALTDRGGELPYDSEGVALSDDMALACVGRVMATRFLLCIRLGGIWSVVTAVRRYDPGILALRDRMTVTEPSHGTLAERERREEARRKEHERAETVERERAERQKRYEEEAERGRKEYEAFRRARDGSDLAA